MKRYPDIFEQCRGSWRGLLIAAGMDSRHLDKKHHPCPSCGGKDRWRFTDRGGNGDSICNQCGGKTGFQLAQDLRSTDFKETAEFLREQLGAVTPERPDDQGPTDEERREQRANLWRASRPIQPGDPVDQYLRGRGVDRPSYGKALRYMPDCRYSRTESFDAMVAAFVPPEGDHGATLHRTYILDGGKAPVSDPRLLMPGTMPKGGAVRLSEPASTMGVAEGIETAFAAWDLFAVPTWATLNANALVDWVPPPEAKRILIFGDNDSSFTGQESAFRLARRIVARADPDSPIEVSVHIPSEIDTDWADQIIKEDAT